MKHQKPARRAKPVTRKPKPSTQKRVPLLIEERATEACDLLEQLFSSLDTLRAAAESCGYFGVRDEAVVVKGRIAESRVLFWLRGLRSYPTKKVAVQP